MALEEISVGIKNALARGQSLQQATQSLILAGYNKDEVSEAASRFSPAITSAIPTLEQEKEQVAKIKEKIEEIENKKQNLEKPEIKEAKLNTPTIPKKRNGLKILIIVLAILLVLVVGAFIGLTLFGDQVLAKLFPNAN